MRAVVAVVVAAVASAGGAVIAGEYEMAGAMAFVIAGLFALAIAEVVASIARTADVHLSVAVALVTQAGLVWGLWIGTGHRLDLAPVEAWVALVAGTAAAALWFRSAGRRGRRTPLEP